VAECFFCLVSGALFTMLSSASGVKGISTSYAIESFGSLMAGLAINLIILWFFSNYQGILILIAVCLILMMVADLKDKITRKLWWFPLYIFIALAGWWMTEAGLSEYIARFSGQRIISMIDTPYSRLVVTMSEGQLNYFGNGDLLFSAPDETTKEEGTHYAMAQHPNPQKVLLISGGYSGMIHEIRKYYPAQIDYVEADPGLLKITRTLTAQPDYPGIRLSGEDARIFIRNSLSKYDVAILSVPPPATLNQNRFYTREFFHLLKKKMNPDGVVMISIPATGDYFGETFIDIAHLLHNTLKENFRNVLFIPGMRNYIVASDAMTEVNVPQLLSRKKIETLFVNEYYLDTAGMARKSREITGKINEQPAGSELVNTDFNPRAVWLHFRLWLIFIGFDLTWLILLISAPAILLIILLKPVNAGLFSAGFSLSSMEIILIYALQIFSGYLFLLAGLVITVIMAGLAIGAAFTPGTALKGRTGLIRIQIIMGMIAIITPLLLFLTGTLSPPPAIILPFIFAFAFTVSYLTGREFRVASEITEQSAIKATSGLYSAEMFGGAAGLLLTSILFIPAFGFIYTGMILLMINFASVMNLRFRNF
jgi:spermidine synthase